MDENKEGYDVLETPVPPTEPEPSVESPQTPENGSVDVVDGKSNVIRTYSKIEHGDDYRSYAEALAKKKGLTVK